MSDRYDPRVSIEGQGRPLVLVPGLNGTGELFYRQIPSLRHTYRVATYSLRDDAPALDVLADDLARVIEHVAPGTRDDVGLRMPGILVGEQQFCEIGQRQSRHTEESTFYNYRFQFLPAVTSNMRVRSHPRLWTPARRRSRPEQE